MRWLFTMSSCVLEMKYDSAGRWVHAPPGNKGTVVAANSPLQATQNTRGRQGSTIRLHSLFLQIQPEAERNHPKRLVSKTSGNFRESKPCWKKDQGHKIKEGPIVNSLRKGSYKKSSGRNRWKLVFGGKRLLWLSPGVLLLCGFPAPAQSQQFPSSQSAAAQQQSPDPQLAGTVSGTVVDGTGAVVAGARVKLSREGQSLSQDVASDSDGQFSFAGVSPGPFQLTITAAGFATQTSSGTLHSGEDLLVPPIALMIAAATAEVQVSMTPTEVAEAEIKDEEKQRVLGVIPNFYVTYNPAAAPLNPKQKFELAWRATVDPVTFGLTGAVAGLEQAVDMYSGYGQGAQGYGKRFGASYANSVLSTFIGGAILPSLFKQDPRYFYKGTGSRRSRFFYAMATAVICKGDNGHWQANYSYLLGTLSASGISNLYYPEADRGAALTFENALIGIGATAANNVLQEFIIRRLTHNVPKYAPTQP